jgi:hypothetical protein
MKESERISKLQKDITEMEMPTNELDKVILDLKKIVYYEDTKRARKADITKLQRFFVKWEYKLAIENKILINACMSYIKSIKQIKK